MNGVYTLVFVQGSRAASHGKHFCGQYKVSTLLIINRVSSGLKKNRKCYTGGPGQTAPVAPPPPVGGATCMNKVAMGLSGK